MGAELVLLLAVGVLGAGVALVVVQGVTGVDDLHQPASTLEQRHLGTVEWCLDHRGPAGREGRPHARTGVMAVGLVGLVVLLEQIHGVAFVVDDDLAQWPPRGRLQLLPARMETVGRRLAARGQDRQGRDRGKQSGQCVPPRLDRYLRTGVLPPSRARIFGTSRAAQARAAATTASATTTSSHDMPTVLTTRGRSDGRVAVRVSRSR